MLDNTTAVILIHPSVPIIMGVRHWLLVAVAASVALAITPQ